MGSTVDRRRWIVGAGASALWPLAATAQQSRKPHRILWVSTESQPDPFIDGFREGLKGLGYADGRDYSIDVRYAPGNPEALRSVVAEITRQNVDLAMSSGPAIQAMRRVTDVPVLFAISGDPVELGIVTATGTDDDAPEGPSA